MTEATEARTVVSWEGQGQPIILTIYSPDSETAVRLSPERALVLAQDLLTCGLQAIKADQR